MFYGYRMLCWGLVRRGLLLSYYAALETKSLYGMLCRIWGWWNNAKKDAQVVEKTGFKWQFELSEEVQLRKTKHVGMIWYRWIRFGHKLYEIKIGKRYYVFYEWELAKTDLRVYSKVTVQEINFKSLKEGHYCLPTKRWSDPFYPTYFSTSPVRVVKLN